MPEITIQRALIAVYDKSGIVDFARALVDDFQVEIISTGGTARHLREAGVEVTPVERVTGFGELLDGRVKTLHPRIFAGILADRDNPEHMRQLAEQGIRPIEMVVVNLYPFERTVGEPVCTFEEAIEMIDIGGPCLLRAAAKNHRHVLAIMTRRNFPGVLAYLANPGRDVPAAELRLELARDVFCAMQNYDHTIFQYLCAQRRTQGSSLSEEDIHALQHPMVLPTPGQPDGLRYGENPHQRAHYARYPLGGETPEASLNVEELPSDPALSFNNYADAHAALELCKELAWAGLAGHAAVFVKHTNACGVGVAQTGLEAYRRAYCGDPHAAMGGVLAMSCTVDRATAEAVMQSRDRWGLSAGAQGFFIEVWIAPAFDRDAIEVIRSSKPWGQRVRLLPVGTMEAPADPNELDARKITGGMLLQTRDLVGLDEDQWEVVTERRPTEREMADLRLAWLVCKHTKSNAVSLCREGMLIGNGAGQMSRVMSCRIATWLARENGHSDRLAGAAAASDGFFPFRDGPDLLLEAGASALIQPGGSKRDAETIAACNQRGATMIFTHTRHFKH